MKKKVYLFLFLAGLALSLLAAALETVPGYMDAEYYYGGAMRMADGKGWSEQVVWNYLDNPDGLPHAAFVYWMPLAALLAVPGMFISNSHHFLAARSLFIILAGLISPLTALVSFRIFRKTNYALLSGLLALFPGFYLVYTANIETFTPYILLGGLFLLWLVSETGEVSFLRSFLLGITTGLMHLARTDGLVWFGAALIIVAWEGGLLINNRQIKMMTAFSLLVWLVFGYGLIMLPWYWRNSMVFGSLLPAGTSRALWLTTYNQLFVYPPEQLNLQSWLQSGWNAILSARMQAGLENLKTLIGVQGQVILLPLILIGAFCYRHEKTVRIGLGMWLVTFVMMSFIFPFAGARGGFFHSGSALQIFFWVLVPAGLDGLIRWGVKSRKWNPKQAWPVFMLGLALVNSLVSVYLFWQTVIGPDINRPVWAEGYKQAQAVEKGFKQYGIGSGEPVLINDAPGYFIANDRAAYVIPDGSPAVTLAVAQRFQIKYLALEKAHVDGLNGLYASPNGQPHFSFITQVNDAYLFEIKP